MAGDSAVPANVVIHPLTSLSLQPSAAAGGMGMAGLAEQDAVLAATGSGGSPIWNINCALQTVLNTGLFNEAPPHTYFVQLRSCSLLED